ncbi:MAG: thiamine pyrophosphate-binding protein [Deltaproteobacteria bacterium]|nr:thiamine pyrophosphate-binding protein [Deltaproteobacteria bacterium]
MSTVAENIVRFLEEQSVEYCFGIPGAQLLQIYDALLDSRLRSVLTTNESSAVFMADGYARASGKVGLCLAIAGPGLTNMATGLGEALLDSSPVVVLVAGVPEDEKFFHIHEVDQLTALEPLVKAVFRPVDVTGLGHTLGDAFRLALSDEPGPVVVEIATDWFRSKSDYETYHLRPQESPAESREISRIADLMLSAEQCGLYLGRGALGAASELRLLAEKLCAPVATTVAGKGVLPEDHPLSVGYGFGPAGSELAQEAFRRCDLVLAIGCKFSELATSKWEMSPPAKLIHVDKSPSVLNLNYPTLVSVCMDSRDFADRLSVHFAALSPSKNAELLELISAQKAKRIAKLPDSDPSAKIKPARLLYRLRNILDRESMVVTDCGNHQLWAVSDFPVLEPGTFLTPSDYQAMGFGIPAAIGAALARPRQRVVCLCGDGGFLMSCMELMTAVREKLDLKVVVFNDGALGLIKNLQQRSLGRESSVDLPPLDYEKFAQSVGVDYLEIATERDLDKRVGEMVSTKGVTLVNVKVIYEDWAPMLSGMSLAAWNRLPLTEKLSAVRQRAIRILKNPSALGATLREGLKR